MHVCRESGRLGEVADHRKFRWHGVLRIGRHWFSSSSVRRSVFPRPDRTIGDGPAAMRAV